MSQPLNRTFSFENGNEQHSMAQSEQELYTQWPSPYRDIPSRHMQVSQPTRFMPPPLQEHTFSPPPPPTHQTHPHHDRFQGSDQGIDNTVTREHQPYSNYPADYDPSAAPRFYPENAGDYGFPRYNGQPHHSDPTDPFISQSDRPSPPHPELPLPTDSEDTPTPVPVPNPSSFRRLPPIQTTVEDRYRGGNLGYSNSMRTTSTTTPGMDNLGAAAAGGGIAGIAMGVANTNERESGIEALRAVENRRTNPGVQGYGPPERGFDVVGSDTPYVPQRPEPTHSLQQRSSHSSTVPLGLAAASPGQVTPRLHPSDDSIPLGDYPFQDRHMSSSGPSYADNPYNHFSTAWDPRIGHGDFHPNEIADDGDDGFASEDPKRRSVLSSGRDLDRGTPVNGVAAGAAKGGILGGVGGLLGRKRSSGVGVRGSSSGQYGPVPGQGFDDGGIEKSEWLSRQTTGRRKLRLIVGVIIGVLVLAIIVGAIVGGVLGSKNSKNNAPSSGQSAAEDDGKGDLNKDSAEIKKLLGNKDLHKVFLGMDYTPFNTQYPDCLTNPPSQNNVTRDMAVLSQLTNAVRLYGTDCNQTEMVLHSIDKLSLTEMKVWLGVWVSNNATTNDRQLAAMYDLLDKYGVTPFAGVIVGNEVLFRKDMTEQELGLVLSGVKSNFTSKKIDLPVATSDLGDNWTAELVPNVDIVMSNVHPFFAGVEVSVAAGWTWNFWQTHDVVLTQGSTKKNFISEVGWPSAGGNECGEAICTSKTAGSVAGIDQMNMFMKDFVCESLKNGTEYFWFEAFDEPWKVRFNTPGKEWEDRWGLMDSERNLKPGLVIPDCGAKRV